MLRLLGPLELVADGRSFDLGGPRQRTVLAMLGLNVERVTSMDGLIAAVWGDDPPETARGQVQVCISGLRKVFAEAGHPNAIRTVSPGYRLELGPDDVDTLRFAHLVTTAKSAAAAGHPAQAVAALRTALDLWRGPAFDGVDSALIRRGATALEEQRLAAVEERVRLDLQLGQHQHLVSELHALVGEHPLRERLHELLMIALYRSGRPAEALGAYRNARDVIVEEVGVEPGQDLRELELAILNRDPSLHTEPPPEDEPPVTVVPRQTPACVADFTGRQAEIADIVRRLAAPPPGYAMPVVAICGRGGVGKTSLAVRVAHELASHFPDGQLYAILRGADPSAQLSSFLRALGSAGPAVPETMDERAALYRTTLSGKRVLVVLDDVTSEDQALPLLPGAPGCAVIMTSRARLGNVPGAHHVDLNPLDPVTALAMLSRIVGADRIDDHARELVHLCEGLPLALRIAGARLAARPGWRVAGLVDRLRDETRRLDELTHRGWTVRSAIAPTYTALPSDAQLLFRLLALVEAPSHHTWTAAALLDTRLSHAEAVLEALVDARLVDAVESPETGRRHYRMHDLVRLYAKEFPTDTTALARVFGGWLSLVDAAHREEYGGDHTTLHSTAPRWCPPDGDPSRYIGVGEALSWWDSSRAALVATIRQAARAGFVTHSWDLALRCVTLFEVKAYFDDWKVTTTLAHNAAIAAGDAPGIAAMRYSLGTWCMAQSKFAEATHWFTQAEDAFTATGNPHGVALTLRNAAHVDGAQGRAALMLAKYARALPTVRSVGDRIAEADILRAQARHSLTHGDVDKARHLLTESLSLSRETHCRRAEAQSLLALAELHLAVEEFDQSRESLHTVLRIVRAAADRTGEAHALYVLGVLRHREGRPTPARKTLTDALELAKRVRDRQVEARSHHALGELALSRGDFPAASTHSHAASVVFAELNSLAWHHKAEALLAEARQCLKPAGATPTSAAVTSEPPNDYKAA